MGSNINPDEIQEFIRRLSRSDLPYSDWRRWPRQLPPSQYRDVLSRSDYSDGGSLASEYATGSIAGSEASTVRSAAPPSIFSSQVDDRSSVGQSSAPSVGVPQMTFTQQFANPTVPAARQDRQILWCEFCELKGCNATFLLDDEAAWIQHHAQHLQDRFPRRLMCWFCDHVPFVAAHPSHRSHNFVLRMQHIREHIFSDDRLTSEDMRPDFHIVKHLYEHGLLDDAMFKHAMAYDETPEVYRLSDDGPTSRAMGQFHDLEKERRELKKRRKQEAKQAARSGGK